MVIFAALGVAPDLDLLFGTHSTYTHSVGATLLVGSVAFCSARKRRAVIALAAALAYGSHLLLDWLGTDQKAPIGIMMSWPLTDRFYESDRHWFMAVSRHYDPFGAFVRHNLQALLWEVLLLVPVVAVVWWGRGRSRARTKVAHDSSVQSAAPS
jgi:hypothetical protein